MHTRESISSMEQWPAFAAAKYVRPHTTPQLKQQAGSSGRCLSALNCGVVGGCSTM